MGEPTQLTRTVNLRAGSAPGEFEMTMATEGEASDGHILSIAGGEIPDKMPLLNGHFNSATDQLGSVVNPRKNLGATPPELTATGRIEMGGEGAMADIRRDLAHMIAEGHVNAVSIRWEGTESIQRVNLPADHRHFVDASTVSESDPRVRGVFFKGWRAMEESVVAIGADPGALMKMADGKTGEQREYWRGMAVEAIGRAAFAEHFNSDDIVFSAYLDAKTADPGLGMRDFLIRNDRVVELDEEPTLSDDERDDIELPVRLRDVLDELRSVSYQVGQLRNDIDALRDDTYPEPDTEPARADRPSNEEADLRPPTEERLTLPGLLRALREDRRLQDASHQRILDDARGRIPDGSRNNARARTG